MKPFNMRSRSRKVLTLLIFFGIWSFITYFFLLRNYDLNFAPQNENVFLEKIKFIENGIKNEINYQNNLIQNFVDKLRLKLHENKSTITNYNPAEFLPIKFNNNNENFIDTKNPLAAPYNNKNNLISTRINNIPVIPILVLACDRVSVSNCIDNLLKYRPNVEQFPIIVSQDCGDETTKKVLLSYSDQINLIEQPDLSDITISAKEKKFKGYFKIARHYGWALNTTFSKGYEFVVIVEDDLMVAPDFFEYFMATYHLLEQDSSLWCVSAWNDNGKLGLIDTSKPELLYRTDFFPGLGWMLTKDLWNELSVKWPKSYWDDWIRQPAQRKNRVCIRPEISRTRTFGKIGVSNGLFFDKYLKHIKLSEEYVDFTKLNLSYLLKDNYDNTFIKDVYNSPVVTYEEIRRNLIKVEGSVRLQYNTKIQYKKSTKMLALMNDFKSGVPRTAYHGIVSFYYNNRRIYLAPNANWKGYDLSWS